MPTSFIAVFTGPVREIQPGSLKGVGAILDVLVEHEQAGGPAVPLTFRFVGLMAEHWVKELQPGQWITVAGSICVDGDPTDGTLYTYYLGQSLTPVSLGQTIQAESIV